MNILKTAFVAVTASSIMALAPSAYAKSISAGSYYSGTGLSTGGSYGVNSLPFRPADIEISTDRLLGSSETATFNFKKGVKNFEKENFEKAEAAFRAVLRADGSKSMDKISLHYLTIISDKQGDEFKKNSYAQAYFKIDNK